MLTLLFATGRRKRSAREEALDAVERHGHRAVDILQSKARHTRSWDRRIIYRLASRAVEAGDIRQPQ